VPAIVRALGDRLESTVSDFWAVNPESDEDPTLTGITVDAERSLNSMYE